MIGDVPKCFATLLPPLSKTHLRALTFTTDYGGHAGSALRRSFGVFHLRLDLCAFASLREIFPSWREAPSQV